MLDLLHLVSSFVMVRLMLLLALPITLLIGAGTMLIVAIVLKPREMTRLIYDETVGRVSRWRRPHLSG